VLHGGSLAPGAAAECGIDGNVPCYNTDNVRLLNVGRPSPSEALSAIDLRT